MTATQRILACALAAILWLCAIVAKHFFPDIDIGGFVLACGSVIAGLGVHGVATSAVGNQDPAPDKGQGGFVRWPLLVAIAGLALMFSMLAGCAGFQQALTGYESAAYAGIKASDDNSIRVWRAVACGTPLSAALRNPDIIPALKALCLPGGNSSNPADLLDAGRVPITINLTLPAAAASAPK